MRSLSIIILLLCTSSVVLTGLSSGLLAEPLRPAKFSVSAPPYVTRVSCGWDYPCPPAPDFRRRPEEAGRQFYRQPGRVYIHNNYGTVNIQVDGHQKFRPAVEPPRRCCEREAARSEERWSPPCGPELCAEETPKDCGVRCWWRRFRGGYCGHGCWAYREQARLEAEEREEKEERRAEKDQERKEERRERADYPSFYDHGYDPPPPPPYGRVDDAPPRYDRPKIDERTPLGRFEGPKYPVE